MAPEVSAYENEAVLQRLIAEHPEILPGVDPELPWVAVRELPMTVGRADVVIVDVEAKLTICECKANEPGSRARSNRSDRLLHSHAFEYEGHRIRQSRGETWSAVDRRA